VTRNDGYVYEERIPASRAGRTLLDHLGRAWPHSGEEEWRRRIERGLVRVDGCAADPDVLLRANQVVTWSRPPWEEPDVPGAFRVLYEDTDLLAVAKPAGLPVLPGAGFLRNTLLARVRERDPAAVPVHRLGRWTSGLVLFARTAEARSAVSRSWRTRQVRKEYRALCSGTPAFDERTIDTPIGPVAYPPLGTLHAASPAGKPASSRFTVVERRDGAFLADVVIDTGRPHQVRIHAAAAGHPLVGDPLYVAGGRPAPDGNALPGDPGYLLHAARLVLPHPASGRRLDLRSEPPSPLAGGRKALP